MTWENVKKTTVVISTGSFEQHGPHLPLATDTLIAEAVAKRLADDIDALVGPSLRIGVSPEHMGFAGTISLTKETFKAQVKEVYESLVAHGMTKIILVNGHGGNNQSLSELSLDMQIVNLTSLLPLYDHAGEVETSRIMYLAPELVQKDKIRQHEFRWPGKGDWTDTRDYSESGVLGDPTLATAEKGEKLIKELVNKAKESLV